MDTEEPEDAETQALQGLGARIYGARTALQGRRTAAAGKPVKVTQDEAAAFVGVTGMTYSRWELGKREPSLTQLLRLAEFFGVEVRELTYGPMPPTTPLSPTALQETANRPPLGGDPRGARRTRPPG